MSLNMIDIDATDTTSSGFFSGSGGADISLANGRIYESSTSTRISSSSTVPSLADEDYPVKNTTPLAGALRAAAGRTFSFGARAKTPPLSVPPPPAVHRISFDEPATFRPTTPAMTTTIPPRLPDEDLDLGGFEEDFKDLLTDPDKQNSHRSPSYYDKTAERVCRLKF